MSFFDPLGLWAVNLDAYYGIGGGSITTTYAGQSISIDFTYTILIILMLGWSAFIPHKLIDKYYGGNTDLSKSASFAQRSLTLWLALSIFIAGSLIISVVLDFLLSIRVFVRLD